MARGEGCPQTHPAAGEQIKRIDASNEGDEVNEMAQIGDEPIWIERMKPACGQRREHHEGGTIIIVRVAGDDDLRAREPASIRSKRVIGIFIELKFIPRFAEVGQRDQANDQNDDQQCEDGKLFRAKKFFHAVDNVTTLDSNMFEYWYWCLQFCVKEVPI